MRTESRCAERTRRSRSGSRRRATVKLANRDTDTYYTDSGGEVTVRYRISRPRFGPSDTESHLEVRVLDSSGLDLVDKTAVKILGTDNGNDNTLVWFRDAREPTTLVLSQTLAYHTAENSGARNRLTATLDQYGDPVRGETVHFISDDSAGLGNDGSTPVMAKENFQKTTSRRGEATVSYFRNDADPGTEDFATTFVEDHSTTVTVTGMTKHYWVLPAPAGQTTTGELVLHDTRRRTFVYDPDGNDGPYRITYDSEDQFNQGASTESYNNFLTNVKEGETLEVVVTGHRASDTNRFTRTTS